MESISSAFSDDYKTIACPKLTNIKQVSEGWINKYILYYELPDGTTFEYESASRKRFDAYKAELEGFGAGKEPNADAVCIVPILDDDSLLMIREFRYPLNTWCIAFPAGLKEAGESLEECVARELAEEVGCTLDVNFGTRAVRPLAQTGFSSTGMTEENVHVVFVRAKQTQEATPEPNELIVPFKLAFCDIEKFLSTNTTLIGTRAQLILELLGQSLGRVTTAKGEPKPLPKLSKEDFA